MIPTAEIWGTTCAECALEGLLKREVAFWKSRYMKDMQRVLMCLPEFKQPGAQASLNVLRIKPKR